MNFINKLSKKKIFLGLLIFSLLSLIYVVFVEYYLGYKACKLCLYQRIPYILVFIFSLIALFNSNKIFWLYFMLTLFISSIVISFYHVGIESGFINESSICIDPSLESLDKEKLLENLKNTMPSCKVIAFTIFGLSLATINFLISLGISILLLVKINYEKNK
tara:strand:- start:91 stop:576 length:486 start_codon:yes stop_codon:yes gene_type:complete